MRTALLLLVVFVSAFPLLSYATQNEINFIFSGMIPSEKVCPKPSPCPSCQVCPNTYIPIDPQPTSPFAELTPNELLSIEAYLIATRNLTTYDEASLTDDYLFYIELLAPNKAEALAYLDNNGPFPARYARVAVYAGKTEQLQEWKVGPLPIGPETTITDLIPLVYTAPPPFNSRVVDGIEYDYIDTVLVEFTATIAPLLREAVNASYAECDGTTYCLTYSDAAPRSTYDNQNTRETWFFWLYDVEGFWIQTIGLETLVWHNSTDPSTFYVKAILFNGQYFTSTEELVEAYTNGSLRIRYLQPDPRTNFDRRGSFAKGDDRAPPRSFEPQGRRFSVDGNHVEWMDWSLEWNHRALTGLQLWDIRFRGDRIVYELAPQEEITFYSGYGASQVSSSYLDTAWGLGIGSFALMPGIDCPETAAYLDLGFFYQTSTPYTHKGAVCIFEHSEEIPLKKHYESDGAGGYYWSASGTAYSLVIRTITTVYNYEYVLDYVFHQSGVVEVKLADSGYIQATYALEEERQFGSIVNSLSAGTLHTHFMTYKVDMDVLGTANSFRVTRFGPVTVNAPWWRTPSRPGLQTTTVASEDRAAITPSLAAPAFYAFVNGEQKNAWGEYRSYRIYSQSFIQNPYVDTVEGVKSTDYSRYFIGVTKRHENEPTVNCPWSQARPWDPVLTFEGFRADNESLIQEDLVAWVTMGGLHVPHSEDMPVATTSANKFSFYIRPFNYFDEDPSTNLRTVTIYRRDENGEITVDSPTPVASPCVAPSPDAVFDGVAH